MSIRRLKALIIKESLQVIRDPSALLIAFILPLILLFLMGYAVSLDARKIHIAMVSQSNTSSYQKLLQSFQFSKIFEVEVGKNVDIYKEMMQRGKIKAIINIDDNFGKNGNYQIQILADATDPNTAGMIQNYSNGVVKLWAKDFLNSKNINIESRYWFNAPVSSRYFLLPGSIAVVMTLIGTLLTALVVAREWERGTMEVLMSTPSSMLEILIGKLVPYFVLGMCSMLLCFIVTYYWYEIPFNGSFSMLLLLSAIYLFPSLSVGLLISTLAKNQFVAGMASIIAGFLPAFMLSGFLFEIDNMPKALQFISHIFPARYFVDSLQTIFLAGDIYSIFVFDIIGMIAIGTLLFLVIMKKSKKGI